LALLGQARLSTGLKQTVILEVVENQLHDNTPPESRQTFERLVADGYSIEEAKRLIGVVVAHEIFDILKRRQPYNAARYIAALKRLPKVF
jgi:hypothetical protein